MHLSRARVPKGEVPQSSPAVQADEEHLRLFEEVSRAVLISCPNNLQRVFIVLVLLLSALNQTNSSVRVMVKSIEGKGLK